ncbi:MAG: transglutaminase family protein [Candidatus Dormibacteria bacterium]
MSLEIAHTTRLVYSEPVAETVMECRMRPLDGMGQKVLKFELDVEPEARVRSYRDGFGNHVHYFNFMPPHSRVVVRSLAVVSTAPAQQSFDLDGHPEDFLQFRFPVVDVPGIRELAERFRPAAGSAASAQESLEALTLAINREFEYRAETTDVYTGVDEVLATRVGVCQDFAHLFVAVCRAMGVPARYVSGYIHSGAGRVGVGASHAWGEAWVPGLGWLGHDPTNPVRASIHHARVAVGRDYHDVPPTRGVYVGGAHEHMEFSVVTREV